MPESINLYKHIILHILHKVSLSIPQSVLLDVVVALKYTDYINAQSALGELVESGLVVEYTTYHRTYLAISETGEQTRLMFEDQLSMEIRREIDKYLKEHRIETLDETALVSDYQLTKDGMYTAALALRDGTHTLFGMTLEVAGEADAIRICDAWESQAQTLYSETLRTLMGGSKEE